MLNILRRYFLRAAGQSGCLASPASPARQAQALYAQLTAAARRSVFFREYGVADTIDGRFDMVALHGWLVLGRLRAAGMGEVAQALSNAIFVAFAEALRDLGNGDMGMGPRMKKLGNAFNGRLQAYEATANNEAALAEAIHRNVYRGAPGFESAALGLARYAAIARATLEASDPAALDFGAVPTTLP